MGVIYKMFLVRTLIVLFLSQIANCDRCLLPKKVGPCEALIPSWFFNKAEAKCEQFNYGGCEGNENRFETKQECEAFCDSSRPETQQIYQKPRLTANRQRFCSLKPRRGLCRAAIKRWYFNTALRQCKTFLFGGCFGNRNNFLTEEDCQRECEGRTFIRDSRARIFSEDVHSDDSISALFSVNGIVFPDHVSKPEESELPELCLLPPVEVGLDSCRGRIVMFTYKVDSGTCEEFVYSGCRGTENLFETKEECLSTCKKIDPKTPAGIDPNIAEVFGLDEPLPEAKPYEEDDNESVAEASDLEAKDDDAPLPGDENICIQDLDLGPCQNHTKVWGYVFNLGCQPFIYGGCDGNSNRFSTVEECKSSTASCPVIPAHLRPQPMMPEYCHKVECDRREEQYYRALGCVPERNPFDSCCPTSWDCRKWDVERKQHPEKCFVAGEAYPGGRFFEVGESVSIPGRGCGRDGCQCFGNGDSTGESPSTSIGCILVKCRWPDTPQDGVNCQPTYDNGQDCCASGMRCENDPDSSDTSCQFEGKTYLNGTKMSSSADPCLICHCNSETWNEDKPGDLCYRRDCLSGGFSEQEKLKEGCLPVYHDGMCCPTDWVCPEKEELEVVEAEGVVVRARLEREVAFWQPEDEEDYFSSLPTACLLPFDGGLCRARIEVYTFDPIQRRCKLAYYGGCDGNANNFASKQFCSETCVIPSFNYLESEKQRDLSALESETTDTPVIGDQVLIAEDHEPILLEQVSIPKECLLPKEEGLCFEAKYKWHFDVESKECKRFVYFGCRGNKNRFDSQQECLDRCFRPTPAIEEKQPRFDDMSPMDYCEFAGQRHVLGQVLRVEGKRCVRCTCQTPPALTCKYKTCKNVEGSDELCNQNYDEDHCCVESVSCPGHDDQELELPADPEPVIQEE